MLRERGVRRMAALAMEGWVERLCLEAGFRYTESMVVLSRSRAQVATVPVPPGLIVRPARAEDHPAIIAADTAAFAPPWQMSGELLALAINRADYLTVAERDGALVGFQLATPGHQGAHLARLAVQPAHQGRGIGAALVAEMLDHYHHRGAREITVNTQDTNTASLALYQRLGFTLNGLRFPVYQLNLATPA
jgi:ribosomal protein S18 acetylase RimI-like enzyme